MRYTSNPGRRLRPRPLAVAAALGLCAAGLSVTSSASAVVPTFPDNVVVFPDRDFVSVEGYERYAGLTALVEVTRPGEGVMGSARAVVSGTDVAFEINHPGGACWGAGTSLDVTPDIQPGDVVSVTFPDGHVEETTTSSATVTGDMVRSDATTITVDGRFGPEVNPAFLEQRIIQPALVDTAIGKRSVRAVPGGPAAGPNGGYSSNLVVDAANRTFQARYEFATSALADVVMTADHGERAMSWQVEDADANRQALTISEYGETNGPGMGGCPAGPGQQQAPEGGATAIRSTDKQSMQVNWTPVEAQPGAAPVAGYHVDLVEDGPLPAAVIGRRLPASATSTTIGGLDPAKSYTVEVRSMTGTEPRLSAPFTVGASGPQLGDTTPPSLSLSPAPSTGGTVQADRVSVTTDGQAFFTLVPLGAAPVPVTTANDLSDAARLVTGPISITSASHLSVAAFDAAGNVSVVEGDYEPAPLPALPAAPTGLDGSPTQTSVALTWSASPATENVTGYQVKVTGPAGASAPTPPVTSIPRQTISGLTPGTSYQFQVAAINAAGTGDYSTAITRATQTATDQITLGAASWKAGDFRVSGTGSQLGATITVHRVNADGSRTPIPGATVQVVAAAPPAVGEWTVRLRNGAAPATNPGRVVAVSSAGGTAGPVTVSGR